MQIVGTTIIIFGITGDLAQKKILPALCDLYVKGRLSEKTQIVGFSRRAFSQVEISEFVRSLLPILPSEPFFSDGTSSRGVDKFLSTITYVQGDFDNPQSYKKLALHLAELDHIYHNDCSNKLFYLSVPPTLYENIAIQLSLSGLSIPCGGENGFARILVEKPFGSDLETARKLDHLLSELFEEEQIFRIDHYLAKDALNDMLKKRRTEPALTARWNNKHITKVEINLFEKSVVGKRGNFYDNIGALRDVGQNHMLQMLAIVAMEIPRSLTAGSIQQARAIVLEHLCPLSRQDIESMLRGQYEGYLAELGVSPQSTTETFFSLTTHLDTTNFSGIPFVLTSGKALHTNCTEIVVHFKDDIRTFTISSTQSLPAYQKILEDCIAGDQTVFTSTSEVFAQWKFITPIVCASSYSKPFLYPSGSNAKDLIEINQKNKFEV